MVTFGNSKRAQAAMEFLMTYGWAILVVLVVIGALSYFGVLSPATLLPEKCTFPVSLSCTDHSVTGTYVALVLQNGAGRDMIIRGATATGDGLGAGNMCGTEAAVPTIASECPVSAVLGANGCTGGSTFRNGETKTITLGLGTCAFVDSGRDKVRYSLTLYYSWLDSQAIMHALPGEGLFRKP